ncbi:MAG: diacylglycerol kinase [Treponema sp.]|nr:diacylglycerol kinase [Treponema sp.]
MLFEEFGSLISQVCSRSLLAADRYLVWTVIVNPRAGGFTIRSRWKEHYRQLTEAAKKAEKNTLRRGGPSDTARKEGEAGALGLIFTKAAGHAEEIANALLTEAQARVAPRATAVQAAPAERPFYLIITAGGDGTSCDVMTSLYHAPASVRENFAILRLPMGTGNDGSDTWELGKALDLLIEPAALAWQRALRLKTSSGKGPFLAFNILSVGLDAFVTHMTNKTKGRLPGDSYKVWVDLAALFYDLIYKVGYMDVRVRDIEGNDVKAFREKLLLLAVGESGRRTYGSHKWVLPDDRNLCAMRQMSLFRKFALKGLFSRGGHIDKPEAILMNAGEVQFSAEYPLLAQMDGETVRLEAGDFPAVIELTGPVIPVIKPNTSL